MSYQLVFWKQPAECAVAPQSIYERLMEEEHVPELDHLLNDRFLALVAETFAVGWQRLDEYNWEGIDGAFQIEVGPQHLLVTSYGLPGEILNEFIDIAAGFGCKLYDPQAGVRFEG